MTSIAITGSLASGKSFTLNYLASLGFPTFSADAFVSNLYQNIEIQNQIAFIILNLKRFDKVMIAELIYRKKELRQKLEDFIHPFVANAWIEFRDGFDSNMLIFAEIPLLFESGFRRYFDLAATTFCSEEARLRRARMRKGFKKEVYELIQEAQWSQESKISKSDFSIDTDLDLLSFELQILSLIKKCKAYSRDFI
jgi:dephospho-CoA kinase